MTNFLKLATASALALALTACATTDDKYSVGVDDNDEYPSTADNSNVELSDSQTFGMDDDDRFSTTSSTQVMSSKSDATIYTGTMNATDYSTVRSAIAANGLNTMLDDETKEYTVFAPNNNSFAGMDLNGVSAADQKSLLAGHVIKGRISSSDLNMQLNNGRDYTVRTEGGQNIRFYRDGENIKVADENGYTYNIDSADMEFANGYVHGIDGVLGRTY